MAKHQLKAYQGTLQKNMTPREAEAMAFIKAATMLEDAKRDPSNQDLFSQALRFNQLFWTILQADIANPANTLPNELKANIMSLSIFVDKQTSQAILEGDPEELSVLIDINRNLAMGLRSTPDAAQAPAEQPQPQPARTPEAVAPGTRGTTV